MTAVPAARPQALAASPPTIPIVSPVPPPDRPVFWRLPAGHVHRFHRRGRKAKAEPREWIVLSDGVELLGRSEGAGYVEEHHLARTRSGRVVQLTRLLFLIARAGGQAGASDVAVAHRVTEEYGKTVTADNVRVLSERLRRLGVLANADGGQPHVPEPDPLLALKLRVTLLGERGVRRLTAPLRPLFFLPIVVGAMAGLIALDVWLFTVHGLAQAVRQVLADPSLFLLAFGLIVFSAAFHEAGHAAGCRVGGGRPGRMGAGIYLAWPAFYTDVTDAYRLDRRARLRTDLGGVYFSCLLVLGLGGVFFWTRFEPLLLFAFLMQMEVVHQLLPFLRLDGYYVVADLVGVPDLFRRTGPVLRSMIPGRTPEPAVLELKRWVRNVVRAWVLVVVPVLLVNLAMILLSFPRLVATAWDSGARLVGSIGTDGGVLAAIDVIQLVFLVIPLVGLGYTFLRLGRQLVSRGWTVTTGRPAARMAFLAACLAVVTGLAYVWWPDARFTPYRQGERGTLESQAGAAGAIGSGRPMFRSPAEARRPLPSLSPGRATTSVGTTTPAPGASTGTGHTAGATTTSAPAASSTSTSGGAGTTATSAVPPAGAPATATSTTSAVTTTAPRSTATTTTTGTGSASSATSAAGSTTATTRTTTGVSSTARSP